MKEPDEMTKQEVVDEITLIETQLEDDPGLVNDSDIYDRWVELQHAFTHSFPKLI